MFYVYAYFEPGGKVPFYIGKGVRHRSRVHLSRSHNSAVARKIAALRGNGFEPEVRLLYFGTDEQCKLEEIRLIRLFGRRDLAAGPLLNCTDGGDGTTKRVRYKRELELLRAAANESARAKKIAGIIESWRNPTTRENRLLGAIKGGATLRDRILANPAERRRLSEQMKRAWRRPAFRQRATAAAQTRFATAQARAEMSAKIRKKHELDAGYRQRISAGVKERLKEPAVRERLLEACRDPVRRAKISASRKGRNNMSEALLERVSRAKSKLAKDICMIRKLHFQGLSIQTLAREYGVSFSTMSRAIRGIRRAYKDGAPNFADVQEAISRNRERGARKRRRLKDGDVAELFRMRAARVPLRRIAVKFQVTHRTVMNILSGQIYRGSGGLPPSGKSV